MGIKLTVNGFSPEFWLKDYVLIYLMFNVLWLFSFVKILIDMRWDFVALSLSSGEVMLLYFQKICRQNVPSIGIMFQNISFINFK